MFTMQAPERSLKRKASSDDSDWGQSYPSSGVTFVDPSSSSWYGTAATAASNHLHLRTRKRYRDNRPDEEVIHANTLKTLFEGARREEWTRGEVVGSNAEVRPISSTDDLAIAVYMRGSLQQASFNAVANTPPMMQYDGAMETETEPNLDITAAKDAKQSNLDKFLGIQRRPTPLAGSYSLIMDAHVPGAQNQGGLKDLPTPPDTSSHGNDDNYISKSNGNSRINFQPCDRPLTTPRQNTALTGDDVDMLDMPSASHESTATSMDSTDASLCTRCGKQACDICFLNVEQRCGFEGAYLSPDVAGLVNSGGARTVWVGGEVGWV